jgi:hypothetical protein
MSQLARRVSRIHKLLGLVIGLQLLFWTMSGLFFTLYPIETIRGDHLRKAPDYAALEVGTAVLLPPGDMLRDGGSVVTEMKLRPFVTGPIYEISGSDGVRLVDARTGETVSPISEDVARQIALAHWAGDGTLTSLTRVEDPPREAGSDTVLWRAAFHGDNEAVFWIDPNAGKVKAVRTTKWRLFDVLWRFHIMDITGADRFDSWWLKVAAFLGLTLVLFGFGLLFQRASRGRLLK